MWFSSILATIWQYKWIQIYDKELSNIYLQKYLDYGFNINYKYLIISCIEKYLCVVLYQFMYEQKII